MTVLERAASAEVVDDIVLPFAVESLSTRGRLVRLGPAIDQLLKRHDYPEAVSKLVAEAVALAALLGSTLKMNGRFQLQTKSDGPVSMLLVDFDAPSHLRALARFDRARLELASGTGDDLLGQGHLAFTIDPGGEMTRYQGVIALEGQGLEAAAHHYFERSEQIPTRVRLAVAEEFRGGENGARRRWRAGGILLQFLPRSPERARQPDLDPGDAPPGTETYAPPEDDAWVEGRSLVETVDDIELIDPALSSERLAYRLFHEPGVRVFPAAPVQAQCSCSRQSVEAMLQSFPQDDRDDMIEDGKITVTCEFCNSKYVFAPAEVEAAES